MKNIYIIFSLLVLHSFAILAQSSKMTETPLTMYDGKRKALLIGNKNYQFYRPLSNTERDVDAMSKVLKNLGFEVSSYKNLDYQATVIALRKFKETLNANDVALIYYSGHGIGSNTQSYLLPVDASIKCTDELEVFVPLSLNKIIKDLEQRQVRNSFVFLDACRNLPNLSACSNTKDAQDPKGLVMPKTNPRGNLIVFATGEGKTADDDTYDKTNSLFTAELIKTLQTSNVGIRTMLDNVINAVEERSNGKQIPQKLEDLRGDFIFAVTSEQIYITNTSKKNENHESSDADMYAKALKLYKNKKYNDGLPLFKQLAEKGHSGGQNTLGYMYHNGNGLLQDSKEAVKWFEKSAGQGNAEAQNNLGYMYQMGYGVFKDNIEAVKWYKKAAEQGNENSQNNLADMYYFGVGVQQDYNQSIKWYKKAAEQGDASGQYKLGLIYSKGDGVTQDYSESIKWYTKAANQNDVTSQNNLGYMYFQGLGVTKDYTEALKWYKKAAELGEATAQFNLGIMYRDGHGVPENKSEAVKWFEKSAIQGNAEGQNGLGFMYQNGHGVKQDYTEAIKWFRKSADLGNAGGQNSLGFMYYYGFGLKKDYYEAVKWYKKASDQGYATGQNSLGFMYQNGQGVKQDYAEALNWYRKSADQGYALAQNNLGDMYYYGYGVNQNKTESIIWYTKAADQGNIDAIKILKLLK